MSQQTATFRASQMIQLHQTVEDIWTPQANDPPTKWEIFSSLENASGEGFALAMASKHGAKKPWIWVQDKKSRLRSGTPFIHGLPAKLRHSCFYIAAQSPEDALFAMEEGLKCAALGFVMGEIAGDPKVLGFTQSKRLAVASEHYGVPLFLLRKDAARQLSAARMRWDIEPLQSAPLPFNGKAPGAPACKAELFRSRTYRPSSWNLRHDSGALQIATARDHINMAALSGDQSLAAPSRA